MAHPMRKLGKQAARHDPATPKLTRLLAKHLPEPPAAADWGSKLTYPEWLNDRLGCCTRVSQFSAILTWTANAQAPVTATNDNVLTAYESSGYDPKQAQPDGSNPTDQGAVEVDVLNSWMRDGVERPGQTRDYLTAYGYIDPKNADAVKRCIAFLGGLYIGLSLPSTALGDGDWVIVLNATIAGGHAVWVHGYDEQWLYLSTWGEIRRMSWSFFSRYCDESYGLISHQNFLSVTEKSPCGEGYAALSAELAAAVG